MRGRPPALGVSRTVYLRVRLSDDELSQLDAARGQATRSDFVRTALHHASEDAPRGGDA